MNTILLAFNQYRITPQLKAVTNWTVFATQSAEDGALSFLSEDWIWEALRRLT
jgi:hypothetical protein